MGFIFPDGGATPSSLFQAFVVMLVFGAPAISTLRAPKQALTMGGAMIVAGAALLPGGSPLGFLMLMPGLVVAWAGLRSRQVVEAPGWMWLIGIAIALVAAVYFALDEAVVTGLIALILVVVISGANSRVTRPQTSLS
ncbi:MAG TPA: hypothetical protein VE027_01320 [Acidimicrobiia bacterium]|nr:hypothetical protein [Acidimicrobiia bacterium]